MRFIIINLNFAISLRDLEIFLPKSVIAAQPNVAVRQSIVIVPQPAVSKIGINYHIVARLLWIKKLINRI